MGCKGTRIISVLYMSSPGDNEKRTDDDSKSGNIRTKSHGVTIKMKPHFEDFCTVPFLFQSERFRN